VRDASVVRRATSRRRGSQSVRLLVALLLLGACAVPADSTAPTQPAVVGPGPLVGAESPAPPAQSASPTAPTPVPTASGLLEIHVLDVGQGDALLLLHDDVTILIDTGRFDRDDVVPLLRRLGVGTIDLLVITHPHADHIGQFDRVMDAFAVTEVWWSGAVTTTRTFERALAALERSTVAYEEPRTGDTADLGPLRLEVLHPSAGDSLADLNDASIALRITFGTFRLVTTGDAERAAEARMVARVPGLLAADVLRLGHHGSRTSTSVALLDAVAPTLAVWSAGAGNSYGHPHPETLALLTDRGVDVLGTAEHGTVTIVTDGDGFEVRTQR
jgi:competence protein ComEC